MQVTTGHSSAKSRLLFGLCCLAGILVGTATALLIYSYQTMEIQEARERDHDFHRRFALALVGAEGRSGELAKSHNLAEASLAMERALAGSKETELHIECANILENPAAHAGARFERLAGDVISASSWPIDNPSLGSCVLALKTNLASEIQSIRSRSIRIGATSALLEALLVVLLLWIARRADAKILESEKEHLALENELYFLANYDSLTHLPNRALFWERFDSALGRATRLRKSVCLLYLDLRGFTRLNEEYGRTIGDRILVEAARRIQSATRSADLVCRMGADEFAILMEDLEPEKSSDAASRLAHSIERQFLDPWGESAPFPIKINCGAARHPHDGVDSEELLGCAQSALKKAKQENILLSIHAIGQP